MREVLPYRRGGIKILLNHPVLQGAQRCQLPLSLSVIDVVELAITQRCCHVNVGISRIN